MEGGAVKARGIRTDLRYRLRQRAWAWDQENKMLRVRHNVIFVHRRQGLVDGGNLPFRYAVAAKFRCPELHRDRDRGKTVAGEEDSKRVGNDGSPDPRVVCEWTGRKLPSRRIFSHHRDDDRLQKSVAPAQSGLPPIKTSPV